ncbi:TIGR01459 family HAD-type hydrolase [Antarcticirhabdus aurantiaca]|uniref:TIGR01459 family HAD-type hydrolase n=1 Tax=Antarcticirhabdus aurantiaca TaxID=2606717 RepID=A0ACD4NNW8_9HYPH|nr:TIGR01459 family HAD-type hydrolase [Antarcticirhabdus aurantiaca]WAJ28310.1 TIGR01459 family HAD-type hydrolase [Jeongeuplla avenae]
MSDAPPIDLSGLMERYDIFFLDQFGVLRDDEGLYEGATDALRALKAAGKTVAILSNSGREGAFNAERIAALGLPRECFDHFVTSGDVGLAVLRWPGSPARAGGRCLTIAGAGAPGFGASLGMAEAASGAEADLVVISGSEAERISMDAYADLLRPAVARAAPCLCLNPDQHKLWQGRSVPSAGAIADLYERLGGTVMRLGKPFPEIYEHALRLCGDPDRERVVCVGDSIEHDILGARRAGLASVLVSTGLAAWQAPARQAAIMTAQNAWPTWRMPAFVADVT